MSLHTPGIGWACVACGDDWPCASRRSELNAEAEISRTAIVIYLYSSSVDAMNDLGIKPDQAYERFLGWLQRNGGSGPRHTHEPGEWRFP